MVVGPSGVRLVDLDLASEVTLRNLRVTSLPEMRNTRNHQRCRSGHRPGTRQGRVSAPRQLLRASAEAVIGLRAASIVDMGEAALRRLSSQSTRMLPADALEMDVTDSGTRVSAANSPQPASRGLMQPPRSCGAAG